MPSSRASAAPAASLFHRSAAEAMRGVGDKVTARKNAERFGIPLLAGSGV